MRIEKDFIGEVNIPDDAYYGIHSVRAVENFPDNTRFSEDWYKAVGVVKLACYNTYRKFKAAANKKFDADNLPISFFDDKVIEALIESAQYISLLKGVNHLVVACWLIKYFQ